MSVEPLVRSVLAMDVPAKSKVSPFSNEVKSSWEILTSWLKLNVTLWLNAASNREVLVSEVPLIPRAVAVALRLPSEVMP